MKFFLVLIGPPGSGKGTQAAKLSRWLRLPALSAGELLRQEIKSNTSWGQEIKPLLAKGELVPNPIIEAIIAKRLQKEDAVRGAIFDGWPRAKTQLNYFVNNFLNRPQTKVLAILIMVSDKEVMNRLSGRRVCLLCGANYHILYHPPQQPGICDRCGGRLYIRPDDKPAVIKKRLSQYHELTAPLIGFFRRQKN